VGRFEISIWIVREILEGRVAEEGGGGGQPGCFFWWKYIGGLQVCFKREENERPWGLQAKTMSVVKSHGKGGQGGESSKGAEPTLWQGGKCSILKVK